MGQFQSIWEGDIPEPEYVQAVGGYWSYDTLAPTGSNLVLLSWQHQFSPQYDHSNVLALYSIGSSVTLLDEFSLNPYSAFDEFVQVRQTRHNSNGRVLVGCTVFNHDYNRRFDLFLLLESGNSINVLEAITTTPLSTGFDYVSLAEGDDATWGVVYRQEVGAITVRTLNFDTDTWVDVDCSALETEYLDPENAHLLAGTPRAGRMVTSYGNASEGLGQYALWDVTGSIASEVGFRIADPVPYQFSAGGVWRHAPRGDEITVVRESFDGEVVWHRTFTTAGDRLQWVTGECVMELPDGGRVQPQNVQYFKDAILVGDSLAEES